MNYCDSAPCWQGMPVGDWATWATALFTLAALMAAGYAAVKSAGMLKVEQKRDRDREKREAEQRQAAAQAVQADYVAAWHVRRNDDEVPEGMSPADPLRWAARIINNSPLPVWDVKVQFIGPDGAASKVSVTERVVPPGAQDVAWPWDLRRPLAHGADGEALAWEMPSEFGVTIEFRDVTGKVWKRDQSGILRPVGVVVFAEPARAAAVGHPATVHTADDTQS